MKTDWKAFKGEIFRPGGLREELSRFLPATHFWNLHLSARLKAFLFMIVSGAGREKLSESVPAGEFKRQFIMREKNVCTINYRSSSVGVNSSSSFTPWPTPTQMTDERRAEWRGIVGCGAFLESKLHPKSASANLFRRQFCLVMTAERNT